MTEQKPLSERPRYSQPLAAPRPFLVPSFDGEPVEILPSEKSTRKIRFDENILVCEIDNRFADHDYPEDDDEGSYEIEIVEEGDEDADFYLEIVDGEVYYVFETEDDISVDSDDDAYSDSEVTETPDTPQSPLQLPISSMMVPNLESLDNDALAEFTATENDHQEEPTDSLATAVRNEDSFSSKDKKPTAPQRRPSHHTVEEPALDLALEPGSEPFSDSADWSKVHEVHSPPTAPSESIPEEISLPKAPMSPSSPRTGPPSPQSNSSRRSILKACPVSPKVPKSPRKKKPDSEKTVTKTYIRAQQYDNELAHEHRVYTWEKPDWTEKKLKSTGKGEQVRDGGTLAKPITFCEKKPWNDKPEDSELEQVDKEELIRRLKGGDNAAAVLPQLPAYRRNQRKLKFSIHGAKIRDGGDIVKPITKATVFRKKEDVNHVANQNILKATSVGEKVRQGADLQGPITQAATLLRKTDNADNVSNNDTGSQKNGASPTRKKSFEWEKPSWTKTRLNSTDKGAVVKQGGNVAKPITKINESKETRYEWEKPEWTKAKLGPTNKGDALKNGESLAAPITELPSLARSHSLD